jgi:hypothetical protein
LPQFLLKRTPAQVPRIGFELANLPGRRDRTFFVPFQFAGNAKGLEVQQINNVHQSNSAKYLSGIAANGFAAAARPSSKFSNRMPTFNFQLSTFSL